MKNINIKGLEHYLVDQNGNVYNSENCRRFKLFKPKILKTWPNKNTGYVQVCLQNSKLGIKPKCLYVHRLVAAAYLPNPLNLPEVNHKDFNKKNNSIDNLEWVTKEQNKWHSIQYNSVNRKYNSKIYKIINNKDLLNDGIDNWIKNENIDALCYIWDCSSTTAYKILKNNNIKCNNHCLPESLRIKIMSDIISHHSTKYGSNFLNNLITKYNIKITQCQFYKMKREAVGKKFIKK